MNSKYRLEKLQNSLPSFFSSRAIVFYFILLICSILISPENILPPLWMVIGLIDVIFFFYFLTLITDKWSSIPGEIFKRKLFKTSLSIRIIYVILIYFFYLIMNGKPFEFETADAEFYHRLSSIITRGFLRGEVLDFKANQIPVSDRGYPVILSVWYIFTGSSVLIARIGFSFLGAWMCIFIYRVSQRNFGEQAARISAIMAMILPAFLYYTGLHLKETVMIFVLMGFIDRADYLLHSRNFALKNILFVIFLGTLLFFFRTTLAAAAWFALISAFLLSSDKLVHQYRRIVILSWFSIAFFFVFSGEILNEVTSTLKMKNVNQKNRLEQISSFKSGNKFANYGKTSVFIPIILIAPFPTLVDIPEQKNAMMSNGNLFTRNVYVYFVFVAFYFLFKKKLLKGSMLLSIFLGTYLLILARSGFALSPRFHVPALPFLIIFAGYGITKYNRTIASYYVIYLIGIFVIILGWNWFKLAGRGFIY